jgi:hypothetical protein
MANQRGVCFPSSPQSGSLGIGSGAKVPPRNCGKAKLSLTGRGEKDIYDFRFMISDLRFTEARRRIFISEN